MVRRLIIAVRPILTEEMPVRALILGSKEYPPLFRIEGCGGIEVHIAAIASYLRERGVELFLVTRKGVGQAWVERQELLHIYRVPYIRNRLLRTFSFNFLAFPISLYLTFRCRVDIIHANDFISGLFGALATKITGRPFLLSAPAFGSKQPEWPSLAKSLLLVFERFSLNSADRIFLFTPQDIHDALKRYKLDRRKIDLLGNATDVKRFESADVAHRTEVGLQERSTSKIVMFVGRLTKSKGLDVLMEAFRNLADRNDAVLVLVGDGPERLALAEKARAKQIENRVFFVGKRTDVERLLGLADVFVLPSLYEGFPITLLEAMAARRAIVATRVGAVPVIVKNSVNGVLVSPGNPDELSHAIGFLLRDEGARLKLSEQAHKTVQEKYSWSSVGEKVRNAYFFLVYKIQIKEKTLCRESVEIK